MKLIFMAGPLKESRFEADKAIALGRDFSNDIVLPEPSVSLVHCQIFIEKGVAFIKDLGSTNGTALNGKRIISAELHDGDIVVIGSSQFKVELPPLVPRPTVTTVDIRQPTLITGERPPAPAVTAASSRTDKELSGQIFGAVTYFLKQKIADGGMGSVYLAEQFGAEGFIKTVAIKTILPKYVQKGSFVSSFIGEAKLVANLVHQNIVQIHHLGRHEDGYYIAMEYIDGINLTDFLNRHRRQKRQVPIDIATFIASRICRGLEYAHNKTDDAGRPLGLVHRDVSPNNIMITSEGEVKLTDFGVAKAAQFMEADDGYLVGSVEYMSPEQADCTTVDARSDLFSLGLLYYELLTGVRVFQCRNNDIDETVERVKNSQVPPPLPHRKDLPESVVAILMKCLKKDPAERYQSAGELGYSLEHDMYSKGYGPTIVTLAKYLDELGWKSRRHLLQLS